ncbi:hypothetical protein CSQ93_12610 [Janthinobacterium sp. BJB426]|uniref:toxin-antitoxin system YwqK family antitoxin n=1 Tax=Janthinobacterium sp. BJB426 TaxID=2048010 RepID=UPI000C0FBD4F|nr:hypothetical protein [Janthinobacterium sp. BJB426]PHV27789.1 hypothetical protein CSQ93_12610 [Janthinobacterium sp. BJB426]
MSRVDYEALEPSEDYLLMCYAGIPFSGIAFENDTDGVLITETSFIDGQKNGISRQWSVASRLIREEWFALNALHGPAHEWHDNGARKSDGRYELGICILEQVWDAQGTLLKDYRIDEDGAQFATLKKLRNSQIGTMASTAHLPHRI